MTNHFEDLPIENERYHLLEGLDARNLSDMTPEVLLGYCGGEALRVIQALQLWTQLAYTSDPKDTQEEFGTSQLTVKPNPGGMLTTGDGYTICKTLEDSDGNKTVKRVVFTPAGVHYSLQYLTERPHSKY